MPLDNDALDKIGRSPEVIAGVDRATERVAEIARRDAPEDTGAYKEGIVTTGKFQRRYVGLVRATDPKSMLIESQTGNLARAGKKAARRG